MIFVEFFVNSIIDHMKVELAQECDYTREAECGRLMKKYLRPYPKYYVPEVIDHLSGNQVFTSEFITGLTIDECVDLDQETRNDIVKNFLILLFTELFQFQYMQTDPNWANFLYNQETKQVRTLTVWKFQDFCVTQIYVKSIFQDLEFLKLPFLQLPSKSAKMISCKI